MLKRGSVLELRLVGFYVRPKQTYWVHIALVLHGSCSQGRLTENVFFVSPELQSMHPVWNENEQAVAPHQPAL